MSAESEETNATSAEAAALRGDRCAIETLWREYRRWVAAVLLAYKPRSEDLEDLLQEVALTMLAKITSVREPGNIRAWVRTVAINAARASGRAERTRRAQAVAHRHLEARLTHASFDSEPASDETARIMRLIETLPEDYREPLLLKAVQGMRSRQIADILGIEEATVDTRVSRARRMLRERFGHGTRDRDGAGDSRWRPSLNGCENSREAGVK